MMITDGMKISYFILWSVGVETWHENGKYYLITRMLNKRNCCVGQHKLKINYRTNEKNDRKGDSHSDLTCILLCSRSEGVQ